MDSKDIFSLLLPGILLLFGLAEAGLAVLVYLKTRRKMDSWLKAEAEVVRLETQPDTEGSPLVYPVFSFKIGKSEHTVRNGYGRSPWNIKPGDVVNIIYNPENPEQAEIVNPMTQWFFVFFLGGGAFLSIAMALVLFLIMRR